MLRYTRMLSDLGCRLLLDKSGRVQSAAAFALLLALFFASVAGFLAIVVQ